MGILFPKVDHTMFYLFMLNANAIHVRYSRDLEHLVCL